MGGASIKQEVDPDKYRLSYCVCDKVKKMSGNVLHKPLMMSDHVFTSGKSSFLDCLGPERVPAHVCRRLISHKVFMCFMSYILVILTLFDPRATKATHLELLHIRLGHFPDG